MILNKQFTVHPTETFKQEFSDIIHYIKYDLKEPLILLHIFHNSQNYFNRL